MSSHPFAQQQNKALQDRIRALEKQLEEKDDENFELAATIATIQAESTYNVKSIEKETKLRLDQTNEELRRATQDANQAHMALARLQQQKQQQQYYPPPAPMQLDKPAPPGDLPSTIFVESPVSPTSVSLLLLKSGPALAQHLLLCSPTITSSSDDDSSASVRRMLHHAQYAAQLQDTDIVWKILQEYQMNNSSTNLEWLKEGLKWSASSRSQLRQACSATSNNHVEASRIQVATSTDLRAIAESLRNPLWKPASIQLDNEKSNPFDPRVCQEWMRDVCSSPNVWHLISTLMQDCTSPEERKPFYRLISKDLISQWEAFAQSRISSDKPRRRHTAKASSSMTAEAFVDSLHLMTDSFPNAATKLAERTVVAILLDLLETETFLKDRNMQLIVAILSFLSCLCESSSDMTLLRTQMVTSDDELSQSGLGVFILVLTASQLTLESMIDDNQQHLQDYKELDMARNHVIRIFHQVLRHVQANDRSKGICFSSLIEERQHDYLGVCSQILVAPPGRVLPAITTMVRLQMEEMDLDREDEEDANMKQQK